MTDKVENMNAKENSPPIGSVAEGDFEAEVLQSKQPVLVEFWAPWSRPCRILDAVLREIASDWAGKVRVVKVNADDNPALSLWYDIHSIPTLLYFVAGNPRARIVGTASKEAILAKMKPFCATT
jgi:thioredoxin 1